MTRLAFTRVHGVWKLPGRPPLAPPHEQLPDPARGEYRIQLTEVNAIQREPLEKEHGRNASLLGTGSLSGVGRMEHQRTETDFPEGHSRG